MILTDGKRRIFRDRFGPLGSGRLNLAFDPPAVPGWRMERLSPPQVDQETGREYHNRYALDLAETPPQAAHGWLVVRNARTGATRTFVVEAGSLSQAWLLSHDFIAEGDPIEARFWWVDAHGRPGPFRALAPATIPAPPAPNVTDPALVAAGGAAVPGAVFTVVPPLTLEHATATYRIEKRDGSDAPAGFEDDGYQSPIDASEVGYDYRAVADFTGDDGSMGQRFGEWVTIEAGAVEEPEGAPAFTAANIVYVEMPDGTIEMDYWPHPDDEARVRHGTDGFAGFTTTGSADARAQPQPHGFESRMVALVIAAGQKCWNHLGEAFEEDELLGERVYRRMNPAGAYPPWADRRNQLNQPHVLSVRISESEGVAYAAQIFSEPSDVVEHTIPADGFEAATEEPPPPPPPPVLSEWVPWGLDMDATWDAPPADGRQATMAMDWHPDGTIQQGIDVGLHLQRSRDNGRTWAHLDCVGRTYAYGLFGVAMDPFNSSIVIGVNSVIWGTQDEAEGAIWRSGDGGVTWSPRWTPTDGLSVGYAHYDRVSVCFDKTSYDAGQNRCMRVYAQTTYNRNDTAANAGDTFGRSRLLRSTDGGVTWTVIWQGPTNAAGPVGSRFRGIMMDPGDNQRILGWGDNVVLFQNVRTGGLPSGVTVTSLGLSGATGRPYISANGQTVLIGANRRLYRSTTGLLGSFTAIHAAWASTGALQFNANAVHYWPSPANPNRIIAYVHKPDPTRDANNNIVVPAQREWYWSHDGAGSFTKAIYHPFGSDNTRHMVKASPTGQLSACWHPTDPEKFVFGAISVMWYTLDGGKNLRPGSGVGGIHFKGMANQSFGHPSNNDRMVVAGHDGGAWVTINRGGVWRPRRLHRALNPIGATLADNGFAVAINDLDPNYVLYQCGSESSGALILATDNWKASFSDTQDWTVVAGSANRNGTCWDGFDVNRAYSGNQDSTTKGVSWVTFAAANTLRVTVRGRSRVAVGGAPVLYYAKTGNTSVGNGGPLPQDAGRRIYKRLNRGASLSMVFNGWVTDAGTGMLPMDIDHHDPHTIYIPGNPAQAGSHVVKLNTLTGAMTHFNILGGPVTSVRWKIVQILAATYPVGHPMRGTTILYARTDALDTGQILFGSPDGGATWQQLAAELPLASNGSGVRIDEASGCLAVASAHHLFACQPPFFDSPVADNWVDRLAARNWPLPIAA